MSLLLWIAIGGVLGSISRNIMPGPAAGGMGVAVPLGIAGAVIGGAVSAAFGSGSWLTIEPQSILVALFTSLVFLLAYRANALRFAS